ncbi:MAG: adenylate kinase family protein [Phycisphaeraceae bacterium]
MAKRYRTLLFMGLPGTGKSTQGHAIGRLPNFVYVDAGEVFRGLDAQAARDREVQQYLQRGELVPDDWAISIWLDHLRRLEQEGGFQAEAQTLIAGGMPRTLEQARTLDDKLEVVRLFMLDCHDEAILVERLSRRAGQEGRADDASESTIRGRIDRHREQLEAVIEHYPPDRIARIDAGGSIVEVLQQIVHELVELTRAGELG